MPLEVVIDLEALVVLVECAKFAQEGQVLARVLLCVLRDHEHEREVVHAERGFEEAVGVDEEDDVLDGLFNEVWLGFCIGLCQRAAE